MQQSNRQVLTTLLLIAIILLIGCGEANTKGPPTLGYCRTIDQSKEIGVFKFTVRLDTTNLILGGGLKLKPKNAWIENSWSRQNHIIGHNDITTILDEYQLILNTNVIDTSYKLKEKYYYFIGNKPLDTFMHFYLNRIDIIKIPLYRETKPKLPPKKERRAFDSLTFIKN